MRAYLTLKELRICEEWIETREARLPQNTVLNKDILIALHSFLHALGLNILY